MDRDVPRVSEEPRQEARGGSLELLCRALVVRRYMVGHGYSTVRVTNEMLETDFVCSPRPIERSARPDGGPLRYRVRHRARIWKKGERPRLEEFVLEGDPDLSAL